MIVADIGWPQIEFFSPLSFWTYDWLSRQTHCLTLERKGWDKAISPGFWCQIPARWTWQVELRTKSRANRVDAGQRRTNLCPGDVTSESLTIRGVQAEEGAQKQTEQWKQPPSRQPRVLLISATLRFLFCHPDCQRTLPAKIHPCTRSVFSAQLHKAEDVSAFTFILSRSTKGRTQGIIIFKRKTPKQNLHLRAKS